MKKTYIYNIILLTSALLITSCSKFLEEKDKDKVIPRTTEQYEAFMHQEAFLKTTWFYPSDLMTDDVEENYNATTDEKNTYKNLYTWKRDIEYDGSGSYTTTPNRSWTQLYNDILIANYVIENVATVEEGTQAEIEYLEAEAYFLRARSYLELAQIYCPVYDASSASTQLGVPLRLDTGVKNTYTRNTLSEVYDQVLSDINSSITLFQSSGKEQVSRWHPSEKAARLLLTRTYLYMGRWEDCINASTILIGMCPAGLWNLPQNIDKTFVNDNNPEIFHSYGQTSTLITENNDNSLWSNDVPKLYKGSTSDVAYGLSNELESMYWTGDARLQKYIINATGKDIHAKWHSKFTSLGAYNYRLSEAYLNRAEALAAVGRCEEALTDVRTLIEKRVSDPSAVVYPSASDQLSVRKFVLDERRREFVGETHRWYDMRRTTSWYPKTVTHAFTQRTGSNTSGSGTVGETEIYTLLPDDPNFIFELPKAETDINDDIEIYGKRVDHNAAM